MGQDVPQDHPDAKLPLHGPNLWPAEVRSMCGALGIRSRSPCLH